MGKLSCISLLLLTALSACVDPIAFETEQGPSDVVFYGNFSQLNQPQYFTIFRTSDFGQQPEPVMGALVVIKDDLGNCGDYTETEKGMYELDPGLIQGIPGRSYHVEIDLPNGASYFSFPQMMPFPVEIKDIYFKFETSEELSSSNVLIEKTFLNVYIDTPLINEFGEPSHIRWNIDEIYSFTDRSCGPFDFAETCYFTKRKDESVLLFENEGGAQKFLSAYNLVSRTTVPYDEFTGRHYFLVNQYAISEETFQYWEKVNIVSNQSGSIFDVQPAKVRGNVFRKDNEDAFVLGYFEVSSQDVKRTFTTPEQIKQFQALFTCLDWVYFREHQAECCNCSVKLGDQIPRPAYWDED